ncbi:hypothetical protein DMA11_20160 [Marinilabiliaceae bacterium JC017]|nr:hypothetical protein DMA11_20160 [Marinilabiliaceae bacterium JC017]
MKIINAFVGVALLATILFTGCVKNEEADGVKALRLAQAELIKAKASATTTAAEAEAAFKAAQTLIEQAKAKQQEALARMEEANARMKELEAELQAAQNEADKELIAIRLEQQKQQIQLSIEQTKAQIEYAAVMAQQQLAEAKTALQSALRDLEVELAKNAENVTAREYMTLYKTALGKVNGLRGDITELTAELAILELYIPDFDMQKDRKAINAMLKAEFDWEKQKLESELAFWESIKLKYEEVVANPSTLQETLDEALLNLANIEKQLNDVNAEYLKLYSDYESKAVAYSEATSVYRELLEVISNNEELINNWNEDPLFDGDIMIGETGEPMNFQSIPWYAEEVEQLTDAIVLLNEGIVEYNEDLSLCRQRIAVYEPEYNKKKKALATAEAELLAAEIAWTKADADLKLDPTNSALITAESEALTAKNEAQSAYNDASTAFDEVEALYEPRKTEETDLLDDIAASGDMIAQHEEKIAEYTEATGIVNGEVARLETELAAANTSIEAQRTLTETTLEAYNEATDKKDESHKKMELLQIERGIMYDYCDGLDDEGLDMQNMMDVINENVYELKAEIAEMEIASEERDGIIEAMKAELANLEAELAVYQKEADHYKTLLDQELGE